MKVYQYMFQRDLYMLFLASAQEQSSFYNKHYFKTTGCLALCCKGQVGSQLLLQFYVEVARSMFDDRSEDSLSERAAHRPAGLAVNT